MERFKWNQERGNEPSIAQLKSLLADLHTVMLEQHDDNGERIADANRDLFNEVSEMLGFVDACDFASGEVIFRKAGA